MILQCKYCPKWKVAPHTRGVATVKAWICPKCAGDVRRARTNISQKVLLSIKGTSKGKMLFIRLKYERRLETERDNVRLQSDPAWRNR